MRRSLVFPVAAVAWAGLFLAAGGCGSSEFSAVPSDSDAASDSSLVDGSGQEAQADDSSLESGADAQPESGPIEPKPAGAPCSAANECESLVCDIVCQAPSCTDGVKNGSEASKDCGGLCPFKCAVGQVCQQNSDCLDGVCNEHLCASASCTDRVKNGLETDVDCGGAQCSGCAEQLACAEDTDCVSGRCQRHVCVSAACTDGVQDGTETGLDCGGSCGPCIDGLGCEQAADCLSHVCSGSPSVCQQPSCSDHTKNGTETDTDCGGACAACGAGLGCSVASDCTSRVCLGTPLLCQAPSCTDRVLNGQESDVDCGGASCTPCDNQKSCSVAQDCSSGSCVGERCGPWASRFGGTSVDLGSSIAIKPNGNIVLAGSSASTFSLGSVDLTGTNFFVAEFTPSGQPVWVKPLQMSTNLDQMGWTLIAVSVDSAGNTYAAGSFFNSLRIDSLQLSSNRGGTEAYLVKFAPDGRVLWGKVFGSDGYDYSGVFPDNAGNLIYTGVFSGTSIDLGGGPLRNSTQPPGEPSDIFVAKLSAADGSHLWSKSFGYSSGDSLQSVGIDSAGDILLGGIFMTTIDFGTGPVTSAGSWDMFVAKLSGASGEGLWTQHYGGGGFHDQINSLAVHPSGDLFITGVAHGLVTMGAYTVGSSTVMSDFVARLSGATGAPQWARTFTSSADEFNGHRMVLADPSGDALFVGDFVSSTISAGGRSLQNAGADGEPDPFVVRLAGATGAHLYSTSYSAAGKQRVLAAAVNPVSSGVVMTGSLEQSIDFGSGPLSPVEGQDIFLVSLGRLR